MFRLKDELWATAFDPYFPHYSKQKLEKAYENYTEQFQNKVTGLLKAILTQVRSSCSPSSVLTSRYYFASESRFVAGCAHRVPSIPAHLRCF